MEYKICEWDSELGRQIERSATLAEAAEFDAAKAAAGVIAVPDSVSMVSARLTLISAGLMAAANAYLAGLPGIEGDEARTHWEYSPTVHRNNALVIALGPVLGKTPAEIDALFIAAAALG